MISTTLNRKRKEGHDSCWSNLVKAAQGKLDIKLEKLFHVQKFIRILS